jgi:pyroglutamyl-peptidase
MKKALITGFEPYGGRSVNPAAEIVRALNGTALGDLQISAICLPVDFAASAQQLIAHIERVTPDITLCLGLWPGEPMIRFERIALNCADFEIPDQAGNFPCNEALDAGGADGLCTTLPVHDCVAELCRLGIPARLSGTAGTYLCNATMYRVLRYAQQHRPDMLAGFMHLPYLPSQVAALLEELRAARQLELHQRADLASMDLQTMLSAVRATLTVCARAVTASR